MDRRAFPIVYAADVDITAAFYERFGFTRHVQLPAEGPAGYVGLRRDLAELAVVAREWPVDQYGIEPGDAPTFEMFVYVDDVEAVILAIERDGFRILRPPATMPWGERVGFVVDPDGNPVAVAAQLKP